MTRQLIVRLEPEAYRKLAELRQALALSTDVDTIIALIILHHRALTRELEDMAMTEELQERLGSIGHGSTQSMTHDDD